MKIKGMIINGGKAWVAMSLEFGLSAQALSEQEAKQKLQNQIQEYLDEAIDQDKVFQKQLLARKAPFLWYARYYLLMLKDLCKEIARSLLLYKSTNNRAHYIWCVEKWPDDIPW